MLAASRQNTNLRIHSVMNQEHWRSPLSSADSAVVDKSMEGMRTSLRNAAFWGADSVLLVPAVVNPETSYARRMGTQSTPHPHSSFRSPKS